jgi:TonB family protein
MGIQREAKSLGYAVTDSQENTTLDLAHPSTGYRSFKQYLQQNIRYPEDARANKVEGRVTVEFTVETSGELTNFRIIRGIGSGCDDELIRLIKDGPSWIPTKNDNVPVQDKAKVRLKFELPD